MSPTRQPTSKDGASVARPTWYLALGDFLSVGFHPGRGRTAHGYDDVLRRFRQDLFPDLRLRNVGCPGETTRALITGERSLCSYPAESQLDAAVDFLTAHPGQVAFITIDVGANDLVNRCLERSGLILKSCATDLAPRLESRVTQIVDALSSAASPGVPIVGMTYHNPFLGLWGLAPGARALAHADQRAWAVFNEALAAAYGDAGAAIADVARKFRSPTSSTPSWCRDAVGSPSTSRSPVDGRGSARPGSSPTHIRTGRATDGSRTRSSGSSGRCSSRS